jgi:hypothetical protein
VKFAAIPDPRSPTCREDDQKKKNSRKPFILIVHWVHQDEWWFIVFIALTKPHLRISIGGTGCCFAANCPRLRNSLRKIFFFFSALRDESAPLPIPVASLRGYPSRVEAEQRGEARVGASRASEDSDFPLTELAEKAITQGDLSNGGGRLYSLEQKKNVTFCRGVDFFRIERSWGSRSCNPRSSSKILINDFRSHIKKWISLSEKLCGTARGMS